MSNNNKLGIAQFEKKKYKDLINKEAILITKTKYLLHHDTVF